MSELDDYEFHVFPSYDVPAAEEAFRVWMARLTGLDGEDLEGWLKMQAGQVFDEVRTPHAWNLRAHVNMVAGEHEVLTERTIEILQYASVGYKQSEIAKLLCISPETVKSILKIAYRKTGCRNQTQLALYALATGQLTREVD